MLTGCNRPSAGITSAISKFSAAAQRGVAPGAGSGALSISDDERRRILEEEQRQLDILKVSFLRYNYLGSLGGTSEHLNKRVNDVIIQTSFAPCGLRGCKN